MGRTTALITLPNAQSCWSTRELVGDFVTLFGTADPEILEHEGKAFTAGGRHYTVDVHGHSPSVYNGTGSRRQPQLVGQKWGAIVIGFSMKSFFRRI